LGFTKGKRSKEDFRRVSYPKNRGGPKGTGGVLWGGFRGGKKVIHSSRGLFSGGKKDFLLRKSEGDPPGRKTPSGKRLWRDRCRWGTSRRGGGCSV